MFLFLSKICSSSYQLSNNFSYEINGSVLTITGSGYMKNYTFFSSPFSSKTFTKVIFEGDILSIGDYAFSSCSGLTSITIPTSVTTIGDSAFYRCSKLTSITIPTSVTTIGDYAFYWCSGLTNITIPTSVTTIGDSAFSLCSSLTSITVETGNKNYLSANGVLFNYSQSEHKVNLFVIPQVESIHHILFLQVLQQSAIMHFSGVPD